MKFDKVNIPDVNTQKNNLDYNIDEDTEFWRFTYDKENKDKITGCFFNYVGFRKFAEANNFFRYKQYDKKEAILVRKNGKVLSEIDALDVNDFVREVAFDINEYWIGELILRSGHTYLGQKTTNNFKVINPTFQKSGKDFAYLFFKNEAWKITEDKITTVKYESLDNMIWDEQIIDAEPNLMDDFFTEKESKDGKGFSVDFDHNFVKMDFLQYLYNTSNVFHKRKRYQRKNKKK